MSRVFVTGSTDGLGYAAARSLIEEGHEIVLHSHSRDRATAFEDLAPRSIGVVIGDLSSAVETHKLAEQVNALGRMDAVIQMRASTASRAEARRQKVVRELSQ